MSKPSQKVKDLKRRARRAWQRRRLYDAELREVYEYIMPFRQPTGLYGASAATSEAQRRVDKVFDATAPKAAFRFAGRIQTELTPIFQTFFSLEAGSLVLDKAERKRLTEYYQKVASIVSGVLASGNFHLRAHEMYTDLYAGTGAMFMRKGDEDNPIKFVTVPIAEIALELNGDGDVSGIFWKRGGWVVGDLKEIWPKAEWGAEMMRLIKDTPEAEIIINQYTRFNVKTKQWDLICWTDKCTEEDKPFWQETMRTCPWLVPRFFVVAGEPYGRGPAQMALPFVKTANKVRELALIAAAFAVMGLWVRRNDGVFNPDTANFAPKAMWTVSHTGGPLKSIERLDVPKDFDVSSIVMADEREQMKMALFDDTLPPDAGAVRSATEIAERMRRLSQDLAGVFGRLTLEIIVPLVMRVIDVLHDLNKLPDRIKIDQMLTAVRVIAPIAVGQQAAKLQSNVSVVQMLQMLLGTEYVMSVVNVEELGPELLRWGGVEERFIRSEEDRKKLLAMVAQIIAQQSQAADTPKTPAPSPQEQFVSGGLQ